MSVKRMFLFLNIWPTLLNMIIILATREKCTQIFNVQTTHQSLRVSLLDQFYGSSQSNKLKNKNIKISYELKRVKPFGRKYFIIIHQTEDHFKNFTEEKL